MRQGKGDGGGQKSAVIPMEIIMMGSSKKGRFLI
jgi:hypothetical protein